MINSTPHLSSQAVYRFAEALTSTFGWRKVSHLPLGILFGVSLLAAMLAFAFFRVISLKGLFHGEKNPTGRAALNKNIQLKAQKNDFTHLIKHQNPVIDRVYQEVFKNLGIFLVYYQEKIERFGLEKATVHMTELELMDDPGSSNLLGKNFADMRLADIEKSLTHPIARQFWEDWCRHPDNLVCHLVVMTRHLSKTNLTTIEKLFDDASGIGLQSTYDWRESFLTWSDDGLWSFQRLLFGATTGPGREEETKPVDSKIWPL